MGTTSDPNIQHIIRTYHIMIDAICKAAKDHVRDQVLKHNGIMPHDEMELFNPQKNPLDQILASAIVWDTLG